MCHVLGEEVKKGSLDILSVPRMVGWGRMGKAEAGCSALRSPPFTASVLLSNCHFFALGDRHAVANCSGERIDRSVCALVEEDGKDGLQEQSDYFEREGSVDGQFLDVRYQLDGKVGDAKDDGKNLDDGRLDDDVYKECILGCRHDTTGCGVGTRLVKGGCFILCKVGTMDEIPEKLGEEATPDASPDDID